MCLEANSRNFSKRRLKSLANHVDFDSAIPRVESWRPSQISVLNCSRSFANVRYGAEKSLYFSSKNSCKTTIDRLQSENLTVSMTVYRTGSGREEELEIPSLALTDTHVR